MNCSQKSYKKQLVFLSVVLFLATSVGLVGADQAEADEQEQYASQEQPLCDTVTTFPEMAALRLRGLGALGGKAAGAAKLGGDWAETLVNIYDGSLMDVGTQFKVGYDEQGLYFLIRCEEPSMATLKADALEDGEDVIADDNVRE